MSKPRPTRDTPAGRAYLDLQKMAKQYGRFTEELLELYALEGFLARLAVSPYAGHFVLKGGVLLSAYDARRPTRDVDFLARQISGDMNQMLSAVCAIAEIDLDDGLVYDTASARAEATRDTGIYPGVRVSLNANLLTAVLAFHVDINLGDPVYPDPQVIALPQLLGGGYIEIPGYPLVMVFAEKISASVQWETVNTRWRDFADIWSLSRQHDVNGRDLCAALETVANHQQVRLAPLSEILDGFADIAQSRWGAWRRRSNLESTLPADFADVLGGVFAFADPALTGEAANLNWHALALEWSR